MAYFSLSSQYDWMGRRIRKTVVDTATGQMISDLIFLCDGWNLIAEVDAQTGELIRTYVWGPDLSGTMQGAGGIGGLLWVTHHDDHGITHHETFVVYDGNGNVMALISASDGSLVAQYEYGPFAEPLRATGPLAAENPIRFSTKYTDPETGLLYYGYRYYSPSLGRWLSRDPVWNRPNLYGFVLQDPLTHVDVLGLQALPWDPNKWGSYSPFPGVPPMINGGIPTLTESEALDILRNLEAEWRKRGWTLAPNLLRHFYTKQGPAPYIGSPQEAKLVKANTYFRWRAYDHFKSIALRLRKKGIKVKKLNKDIKASWSNEVFSVAFLEGELFYAFYHARFGYIGKMHLNCKKWKARVKMILRDSYDFHKTGFLGIRLLSRSYEAAHYLQSLRGHGYEPFDVYLEWNDEFAGEFDLIELHGVGGRL